MDRLGGFQMVDAWRKEVPGGESNHIFIWCVGKAWGMLGHDGYRNQVKQRKPEMNWTAAPVASGPMGPKDNRNNVYASGSTLSAQKGGKNLEQAWDFLKFSVQSEAGGNVQKSAGNVSASADEYGLKQVLPMFPLAKGFRAPLHSAYASFEPIYFKAMNDYVTGASTTPIRASLAETNRLIQNILDEYWASARA